VMCSFLVVLLISVTPSLFSSDEILALTVDFGISRALAAPTKLPVSTTFTNMATSFKFIKFMLAEEEIAKQSPRQELRQIENDDFRIFSGLKTYDRFVLS